MEQSTLCVHRWILSEPRMSSIKGVCRHCGARRTYPSGLEFPEAVPDYEELDAGLPAFAASASHAERYTLA